MADDRIQLPQSGGGLVRYSETTGSKIQLTPIMVIVIIAVVTLFAVLLHVFKPFVG